MFSDQAVNNLKRMYETQVATEFVSSMLCPKKGITPSFASRYCPVHQ
jgi:hypothetical protein